jgi:hypothetical protein
MPIGIEHLFLYHFFSKLTRLSSSGADMIVIDKANND